MRGGCLWICVREKLFVWAYQGILFNEGVFGSRSLVQVNPSIFVTLFWYFGLYDESVLFFLFACCGPLRFAVPPLYIVLADAPSSGPKAYMPRLKHTGPKMYGGIAARCKDLELALQVVYFPFLLINWTTSYSQSLNLIVSFENLSNVRGLFWRVLKFPIMHWKFQVLKKYMILVFWTFENCVRNIMDLDACIIKVFEIFF